MEIKIPFSLLGVGEGEEIAFDVHVQYENSEIEKIPVQDYIHFKSPSKNFELEMWSL
jgi:hypothetical protein